MSWIKKMFASGGAAKKTPLKANTPQVICPTCGQALSKGATRCWKPACMEAEKARPKAEPQGSKFVALKTDCADDKELVTTLREAVKLLDELTLGLNGMGRNAVEACLGAMVAVGFVNEQAIPKYNAWLASARAIHPGHAKLAALNEMKPISKSAPNPEELALLVTALIGVRNKLMELMDLLQAAAGEAPDRD